VLVLAFALALALGACTGMLTSPPPAAPESFPGIAGQLGRFGVNVESWTSGDSGCGDAALNPTAIRFTADGLDQSAPVTLRIYIFKDRETWDRRLADVDTCSASWATDAASFVIVQTSPYVVAGQGPFPPQFDAALRKGLAESAGSGD
jgi:hypothetical protein